MINSESNFITRTFLILMVGIFWIESSNGMGIYPNSAGKNMTNKNQRKALDIIELPDEDYFSLDDKKLLQLQLKLAKALRGTKMPPPKQMKEPQETTYTISSPATIDVVKHDNIPVLFASEESGLRKWQVSLEQNMHIIMLDRITGKLNIRRYSSHPQGKRQVTPTPSKSGQEPTTSNKTSIFRGIELINLKDQFKNIPLGNKYSISVVVYDHSTNTRTINLLGVENSKLLQTDSTPSQFINLKTQTRVLDDIGIEMTINVAAAPSQETLVSCSASLTNENVNLLTSDNGYLLPASIVMLKLDEEMPEIIEMNILVSDDNFKNGKEKKFQVNWEFELSRALYGKILEGDFQAYLLIGDQISNAVLLENK
jgi:hypothetical protein